MTNKNDDHSAHYEDTKAGKAVREQGAAKVKEHDRKKGEFARGEKRQGDGV